MTSQRSKSTAMEAAVASDSPLGPLAALVEIQHLLLNQPSLADCYPELIQHIGVQLEAHQVLWYSTRWSTAQDCELDLSLTWGGEHHSLGEIPSQIPLSHHLRQQLVRHNLLELPDLGQMAGLFSSRSPYCCLLSLCANNTIYGLLIIETDHLPEHSTHLLLQGIRNAIVSKAMQSQTATALFACEKQHCHLVETTNEGVWILDRQFQTTFMNARLAELIGYAPYELLGVSIWEQIAPAHLQVARTLLFQLHGRHTEQLQLQLRHRQGHRIWVLIAATAMLSESGQEQGILLTITNISRQRQAERERDRFFNISADLFCITNFGGRFKRLNPAWLKTLGHDVSHLLNQSYFDFVHPDDQAETQAQTQRLNRGVQFISFQNRYRCADGSYRWLEWNAVPYDQEGAIYAVGRDITRAKTIELERHQATRALAESEERFRQLAESIDSVFWMLDVTTHRLLYISPAYEQVWGRTRTALMQPDFHLLSTIHPEDQPRMAKVFREQLTSAYDEEYRIVRPDGRICWVHDHAFPVCNDAGEVYRLIGIAEDISDRKHTEEVLNILLQRTTAQIGNEFFQALVEHIAQVLQIRYVFITRCLDHPPSKVETLAFWTTGQLGENFRLALENTPCGQSIYQGSCFYAQGVQDAFPQVAVLKQLDVVGYAGIALLDSNQDVLGHIAIMDDKPITDKRLPHLILQVFAARAGAELERLKNEEDLRQSEERLQLALTGSNLGLWDWCIPADTTYFSPQWKQMLGYAPDEPLAGYSAWHTRLHPDDRDAVEERLQAHLRAETTVYQAEFRLRCPSGDWVWIFAHGKVVERDTDGTPLRITGIHQDITERKAIERMKDEFLSMISHELRTPMTSIHGALKLLNGGRLGPLSQQAQKMLAIAEKNTERLSRLINDILDLKRLESGQMNLTQQVCSVHTLLQDSLQSLEPIAQTSMVRLQLTAIEPTLQVWADPDCLSQVVTNLLSNAIKFSPAQSVIVVRAIAQEKDVCFQVRDRGRGIPADQLETIFERFQQVDTSDSREKGGTGLGLAICRHLVEQHGGKIWAESTLGEGSTFSFTCPTTPS